MKFLALVNILILMFSFSAQASVQAKSKRANNEALAFCWQNKDGKWWCDGPKQILWAPEKSLKKAVVKVGCDNYKKPIAWAGNNRVGHLFKCGKKLTSYDRDIRRKYGVKKQ
ncbi:hypothetical protein [Bacteriovorax sp. DB6_IX]|uniref:hypothetical protein n=1 Tax=Bacteriovorax sp. DB6_IX TaxID=1353530 RepID=UPI000558B3D1|nr:hypothetical protein [Bacteriovorax sp. DB6_IX]